jgi:hypothetical protein
MPSGVYKHKRRINKKQEKYIIKQYKKGKSSYAIADNIGCCKATVLRYLEKNNIPRRTLKEAVPSGKEHPFYRHGKSKNKGYHVKWQKENSKHINKYHRERRNNNPKIKINTNMGNSIRDALRDKKNGRHWEDLVDYTLDDLMNHLENKFEDWMTWDNYGEWHIDHIKPRSWFNFESIKDEEFKKCWSLENLQPLEAHKNLVKNNRYIG